MRSPIPLMLLPCILVAATAARAVPAVTDRAGATVVEARSYRATFARDTLDVSFELKGADGQWHAVTKSPADVAFALARGADIVQSNGLRATRAVSAGPGFVAVGRQAALDPLRGLALQLDCLCADDGILMGARLVARSGEKLEGVLWAPPRLALSPGAWDGYAFYGPDGRRHAGLIGSLQPTPAYAGVSPWGQSGDAATALDPLRPALIVYSGAAGAGLGVVFVDYARDWRGASTFLQRYNASALYLYGGFSPAGDGGARWAWLAPFPAPDALSEARRVDELVRTGSALVRDYRSNAPAVPEAWSRPVPDFPAALRRSEPVRGIANATVFTVNEGTAGSAHGLGLARKTGPDMLIRAWFKWGQAPPVAGWRSQPQEAHRMGALFGGGITCSALYDGENGLTREQVLDMATRGPDGKLVDAWGVAGIRHGSLSSPAYLDYLFRWCREQIDAGADYLFMDEHTAALSEREGYDDHSLADFRRYLLQECPRTRGWAPDDARWRTELGVALNDPKVCPDGRMDSFEYREHLRAVGAVDRPADAANRLFPLWADFRAWRDDRAWRALTDRIRAYARERGRTVLISANGIARYVDLQVLGVWDQWTTDQGHVDLRANLLPNWRTTVVRGQSVAGRKVPVVLFHDWGMGDPPFPWMAVPPSEREVWMRTRGAEIYAAGGFFAFPVEGPFGCDAGRDGTLPTIARQTAFYQRNRALYHDGQWVGCEKLTADAPLLSIAAWWLPEQRTLAVHVINRDVRAGELAPRGRLTIRLPVSTAPREATVVSPDFEGESRAACRLEGGRLVLTLDSLDACSVALLRFDKAPDLSRLADPVRARAEARWTRPARSEFTVRPDGTVENDADLVGYLQGMLHTEMRNPPTFMMNAGSGVQALVHVRAVATAGARIVFRVDGKVVKTVGLPDLDGKNDGAAREYDRTLACPVPPGRHRVTVDNVGGDWAVVEWYEFRGSLRRW